MKSNPVYLQIAKNRSALSGKYPASLSISLKNDDKNVLLSENIITTLNNLHKKEKIYLDSINSSPYNLNYIIDFNNTEVVMGLLNEYFSKHIVYWSYGKMKSNQKVPTFEIREKVKNILGV